MEILIASYNSTRKYVHDENKKTMEKNAKRKK